MEMSAMRKKRHNKIRNTGLLFEFLLRQITVDVLNKNDKSKAVKIVKENCITIFNIKISNFK